MAITSNNSSLFSLFSEELYKYYFENEQGRAVDNMGGTTGGGASSDAQAQARALEHNAAL